MLANCLSLNRLPNNDKFSELDKLIASVAHFRVPEESGILDPKLLKDIFSTRGIPRLLFQTLVGNSEETYISIDTLMTFLIVATSPRYVKQDETRLKILVYSSVLCCRKLLRLQFQISNANAKQG